MRTNVVIFFYPRAAASDMIVKNWLREAGLTQNPNIKKWV
jgi:hypothetical protein